MQKLFEVIGKIHSTRSSVLITGESGTGKELVARALHTEGSRAKMPFVAVNCGAIPEELMESELFGHKKGSFTGAVYDKRGLFQEADGGTLFLDEIGELSLNLQVKILRALQERKVKPVGGTEELEVDVRVVAATNRDLEAEVARGAFRCGSRRCVTAARTSPSSPSTSSASSPPSTAAPRS
jgi:two-component system response regulator PilR (NtrC family)